MSLRNRADTNVFTKASRGTTSGHDERGGLIRIGCREGSALNRAGRYANRTAYWSTAIVDTHHPATLGYVTGNPMGAHALATARTVGTRVVQLSGYAIRGWRHLASLDNTRDRLRHRWVSDRAGVGVCA